MSSVLRVVSDTVFKRSPNQSSALPATDKVNVKAGRSFKLHSHALDTAKNHVRVALADSFLNGFNTWYVYIPHVEILEAIDRKPEADKTISFNPELKPKQSGIPFNVPGISRTLFSGEPIGRSKNFLWYEATHGLTRMPKTATETRAIIRIAESLQIYRDKIGKPFMITSWFRPEPWNSRVGGASQSRHLVGDAIDFYIDGWSPWQMYNHFDPIWTGGVGKYRHNDILHLDARGWNSRWYD